MSDRIVRAWEPPEEVVFPRALAYSPELQPEDYGVLLRLLLRDPASPTAIEAFSAELQRSGWKMGERRLADCFRRLTRAGHVSRERVYDADLKRPVVVLQVFRNPANNHAYVQSGAHALSQVSPTPQILRGRPHMPISDSADSAVSAGQRENAESAVSVSDSAESAESETPVSAGQRENADSAVSGVSPPTPPPGGETPPLTPHGHASVVDSPPVDGEGEESRYAMNSTSLTAVDELLRQLPEELRVNSRQRASLAPLLLETVIADGWDIGPELLAELSRPHGKGQVQAASGALRWRIKNLRPPRPADKPKAGSADEEPCPNHPHRPAAACRPCLAADDWDDEMAVAPPASRRSRPGRPRPLRP